jgi:TolB protein
MSEVTEDLPVRWARKFAPGQRAELHIHDLRTQTSTTILTSDERLFEAPNWHPEQNALVVNADGLLFRVDLDNPALVEIPAPGLPELNNDHVLSPDGKWHYLSANDGHIYRLPWQGGTPERVTQAKDKARRFRHWLHGISPDGRMLSYVGTEDLDGDEWGTRALWLLDLDSGVERLAGSGFSPADGPEFSPDGKSLYFNSEFRSKTPGHAQIFQFDLDSGAVRQLTSDDRVNWFGHPSPDGKRMVQLSYEPGTMGHPADQPVKLRLIDLPDGAPRDLVSLFGGQGTINVPSWAPDSQRFAYVSYPFGA